MIEINLLPEDLKKAQSRLKRLDLSGISMPRISVLKAAGYLAAFLAALHLAILGAGLYKNSRLAELSKRRDALLDEKKEADSLKAQSDTINKKVSTINELMGKRFSWSKELNSLSDSMTQGIWLYQLDYDERAGEKVVRSDANSGGQENGRKTKSKRVVEKTLTRYLILSGYASSMGEQGTALVAKFIKSLKDNPDFYSCFSDIELGSIKSDRVEDQEVMNFRINCLFKEI